MQLVGGKRTEALWLYAVAGALMVGGPVWHELYVNHYPARPEAFLLPLLVGAIGAIVAVVSRVVGGLLGTIAFGGLLFVFSDLQLDPQLWTYTALVLAGCIALAQLLISHRAAISALALGAFYLTSLLRPAVAPPPTRLDTEWRNPPTLFWCTSFSTNNGVGGLRAAGDSETADFLKDLPDARIRTLRVGLFTLRRRKSRSKASCSLGDPDRLRATHEAISAHRES
jgi:hypothetical protein